MKKISFIWMVVSLFGLPCILNLDRIECVAFIAAVTTIMFAAFYKFNIKDR